MADQQVNPREEVESIGQISFCIEFQIVKINNARQLVIKLQLDTLPQGRNIPDGANLDRNIGIGSLHCVVVGQGVGQRGWGIGLGELMVYDLVEELFLANAYAGRLIAPEG